MTGSASIRTKIRACHLRNENQILADLHAAVPISAHSRKAATKLATKLVKSIRTDSTPGLMEVFLAEYGLSTDEGIALMCLAEALLRVPDASTIDALIEDKIAPSSWGEHLGNSSSSLVNASTWALMLTGKVLQDGHGLAAVLHGALRRLGEPVIRAAVKRAMKELGQQFVLGQTIDEALKNGKANRAKGFTFSYDMLGEAALTAHDATAFFNSYADAIGRIAPQCSSPDIRSNPGISIKLSALHPRYEAGQRDRVMRELTARTLVLTRLARDAGMGLNIDAEEAARLDLSLDVISAVLSDPSLAGWDGFGVVVQAYGNRAAPVIDWLYDLATGLDRKIMVRLVKGAYWDTEIKLAQVEGLTGFPVFTRKAATDVSYICCAQKLLSMTDRIYPQFATHNAHTVAAILELAPDGGMFEFQRLHGMGEALHDKVRREFSTACRIYAPVGAHRDLLAYLVRRLLENGANSSFVNQIIDTDVPPETVATDPFAALAVPSQNLAVISPTDLFQPERQNSRGWDLANTDDLAKIDQSRARFRRHQWRAGPAIAGKTIGTDVVQVINPADPDDTVGKVVQASPHDVATALAVGQKWVATPGERAVTLLKAADLYEDNYGELFAILCREAGKNPADAVSELREAVDFLRFYAARGTELQAQARGLITCISPWNFPLAIFTGQIAAALAAGNGVLAKPAEATGIIAGIAVSLLHKAGVPRTALQLLPGPGSTVGARLSSDARIAGVCFTGSTATAQSINRAMAEAIEPDAPLIAETGGINAMIVDSTALPEQAVRDIVVSAFQSAGQRCSALRILYLQKDIAGPFLDMLFGAMDELALGNPWEFQTDIGPVIDEPARATIAAHIETARHDGRLLKQVPAPGRGNFIGPAVLRVGGIGDIKREIFGPVLHVATFGAGELDAIVDAINASGYGLTFGMHSRIDDRVEQVTSRLRVGNIYINRNQIGAVVGSQPFGGEGLSGTGPKAGGPDYVARFTLSGTGTTKATDGPDRARSDVQHLLDAASLARPATTGKILLPGPTGESNQLSINGRGVILCLGPTSGAARKQAREAAAAGCAAVIVAAGISEPDGLDGKLDLEDLQFLNGIDGVAFWGNRDDLRRARMALARRSGPIVPLICDCDLAPRCRTERHICIDTTAAGGNASLLADAT